MCLLNATVKKSPLLQHFGGSVPVYIEEGEIESYSSILALYRVELAFDSLDSTLDSGRVVTVKIYYVEQLYSRVLRFLRSVFRKEFLKTILTYLFLLEDN